MLRIIWRPKCYHSQKSTLKACDMSVYNKVFTSSTTRASKLQASRATRAWQDGQKKNPLRIGPPGPQTPPNRRDFFQDTIQDAALPSVRCDMRNVAHVAPVKGMRLPSWMIIPEWLRSKLLANDCYNHWKSISIVHQPHDYNSHYYKYPIDSLLL